MVERGGCEERVEGRMDEMVRSREGMRDCAGECALCSIADRSQQPQQQQVLHARLARQTMIG